MFRTILLLLLLAGTRAFAQSDSDINKQVAELTALVQKLQARVSDMEQKLKVSEPSSPVQPSADPQPPSAPAAVDSNVLRGTTVNFVLDGYYGYNFNNPIGRVNLLRAFDVSSKAFSLNQADIVLENAPDPAHGKRFGLRLDLQYGQATATLQGNASNEPRPDVYRNIFQVYGTYVVPIGSGLTVDFGKWASSIGIEGNYTKDQMNYSRSFWFDFLPFYHMGARFNYKINDALALNYWITNGTQQTEPFNGFKDQLVGLNVQPRKNIAWTINYYFGQEHPDFQYFPGSTQSNLPMQQGIPFAPITNAPSGKLHVFDSYATWAVTPKLTFAGDGDYVIERLFTTSSPVHTAGGTAYARYQLTPRTAIAGRAEYLSDRGGLFTGTTQSLKELTVTLEHKIADGFLLREEWRRDASNHPYFLTDTLGILKKEQNTATLGLVWWFGAKEGIW
ncbi:MAG TPA: outer membrane beta-barrel protein [Bryobacteraceae bacterium]|nr:outer membrane beta-barrel protein [Bryobacteraceae bacterium]